MELAVGSDDTNDNNDGHYVAAISFQTCTKTNNSIYRCFVYAEWNSCCSNLHFSTSYNSRVICRNILSAAIAYKFDVPVASSRFKVSKATVIYE